MGTIVAAYQPHYLPQLHYLARAQEADVFIIYDDVQFVRRSPHHRAAISSSEGNWLTVPVQRTGVDTPLVEARIDMSKPWVHTHLDILRLTYGEQSLELAPFYERLCPRVLDIDFVRNNPEAILGVVDSEESRMDLDSFTDADRLWRQQRQVADDIREEKNAIGEQIAARKRADPSADITDLTAGLGDLDYRINAASEVCREAKTKRDNLLFDLSKRVETANGQLEWMTVRDIWSLDGADLDTRLSTVAITDLTVPLLEELLARFDVTSEILRSSELDVEHPGDASEYLARLTEAVGGDCYLSGGTGYENYLNETPFDERGLDIAVQDWTPTWPDGNVCALDVLYGTDNPGAYIR